MKRQSIEELRRQLIFAEARATDSDWMVRDQGRKDVKRLKTAIARRERDQIYRDLGMSKVKGTCGGTYYD